MMIDWFTVSMPCFTCGRKQVCPFFCSQSKRSMHFYSPLPKQRTTATWISHSDSPRHISHTDTCSQRKHWRPQYALHIPFSLAYISHCNTLSPGKCGEKFYAHYQKKDIRNMLFTSTASAWSTFHPIPLDFRFCIDTCRSIIYPSGWLWNQRFPTPLLFILKF